MSRYFLSVFALLGLLAGIFFLTGQADTAYSLRDPRTDEPTESYIRDQMVSCLDSREAGWRGRCLRDLAARISAHFKLTESLPALAAIDEEPGIKQRCHALVHYLAQNEYKRTADLGGTFRQCFSATACGEGCFHGAVEGYISEHGGALQDEDIPRICKAIDTRNRINFLACNHGLGHAFMLESGNDVPFSLERCDAIESEEERTQCHGGVFMENVFSFGNPDHPTQYFRPQEPTYPCSELPERYRNVCYGASATFVIQNSPGRYDTGALFCNSLDEQYRSECFGSLGADAVLKFEDPRLIKTTCDKAPRGPFRDECIHQALIFLSHGSDGDPETLAELCFVVEESERKSCFRAAGTEMESWYPGERAAKCALMNAKGTESYGWCLSG